MCVCIFLHFKNMKFNYIDKERSLPPHTHFRIHFHIFRQSSCVSCNHKSFSFGVKIFKDFSSVALQPLAVTVRRHSQSWQAPSALWAGFGVGFRIPWGEVGLWRFHKLDALAICLYLTPTLSLSFLAFFFSRIFWQVIFNNHTDRPRALQTVELNWYTLPWTFHNDHLTRIPSIGFCWCNGKHSSQFPLFIQRKQSFKQFHRRISHEGHPRTRPTVPTQIGKTQQKEKERKKIPQTMMMTIHLAVP